MRVRLCRPSSVEAGGAERLAASKQAGPSGSAAAWPAAGKKAEKAAPPAAAAAAAKSPTSSKKEGDEDNFWPHTVAGAMARTLAQARRETFAPEIRRRHICRIALSVAACKQLSGMLFGFFTRFGEETTVVHR